MTTDPFSAEELIAEVSPFCGTFVDGLLRDDPGVARVRSTIATWYSREPTVTRRDVRRRLLDRRSPYNSRAAFYELAVGEALRRIFGNAYRPVRLPQPPDWRVGTGPRAAYFEVATVEEDEPPLVAQRRRLLCELSKMEGPWWVVLDWQRSPGLQAHRPSTVRHALQELLDEIGPVSSRREARFAVAGSPYPVTVLPRAGPDGSIIGLDDTRDVTMNPGEDRVRSRVREKASRYRHLADGGHPLIVVVCTDYLLVDDDTLLRVAFGRPQIQFGTTRAAPTLDTSGLFAPNRNGPRHTRLSEVWLVKRAFRSGHLGLMMTRAINPWAVNPIGRPVNRVAAFRIHVRQRTFGVGYPRTQQFLRLD